MRRSRALFGVLVLLATACSRTVTPLPPAPTASPTAVPRVEFPRDAGPHDVLTEWWYYTGHLRSEVDARSYGFEFTIFQVRRQNAPTGYLAHYAITDVDGQQFSHQARVSQGEPRTSLPLDVDGWTLSSDGNTETIAAAMQTAAGAEVPYAISLRLIDQKPPALHHGGFIDYGPSGGSYYYSRTRIEVHGQLTRGDGGPEPVSGQAWMDHQWGNFVVVGGGWDWFSLQFEDRTELMLYVLRTAQGEITAVYGTQVLADGTTRELEPGAVRTARLGTWTSPHTGAVYPSGWQLSLPNGEQLIVRPVLADQELYFPGFGGMAYWEGAVSVEGARTGVGYVELTGYAGS